MNKERKITPEFQAMLYDWLLEVEALCEKSDELPEGVEITNKSKGYINIRDSRSDSFDVDVECTRNKDGKIVGAAMVKSAQDGREFSISFESALSGGDMIYVTRRSNEKSILEDENGKKYLNDVDLDFRMKDGKIHDVSTYGTEDFDLSEYAEYGVTAEDGIEYNQTVGENNFRYLDTAFIKATRMIRGVSMEKAVEFNI